jgi:hypothetical protein
VLDGLERAHLSSTEAVIDFARLQVGDLFGSGGSADVFRGKLDNTQVVAVKKFKCTIFVVRFKMTIVSQRHNLLPSLLWKKLQEN